MDENISNDKIKSSEYIEKRNNESQNRRVPRQREQRATDGTRPRADGSKTTSDRVRTTGGPRTSERTRVKAGTKSTGNARNARTAEGARASERLRANDGIKPSDRARATVEARRVDRAKAMEARNSVEPAARAQSKDRLNSQRLSGQRRREENVSTEKPVRQNIPTSGSNEIKVRAAKNMKRRQTRNRVLIILAVLLVIGGILGAATGMLYQQKYGLSKEEMNATKYYDMSRDADLAVVLDSEVLGVGGLVEDGIPYLSYEMVTGYINSRFYWDENNNSLLYTLEDGTVEAKLGDSSYSKGSTATQTDYQIIITEGSQVYVAAEYVQIYTNIDYTLFTEPNRLVLTSEWGEIETVTAKKDTEVRYQAGVKSEIISYVTSGDVLIYLEEEVPIEDWTKVCTADGYVGYIQTKNLGSVVTETISREFEEQVYTNISVDYTINMAWHQVTSSAANDTVLTTIADTSGLTTIAPTWFFIDSTSGDVVSYASSTYVNYAHQLGVDVWAVLNDFDGGINSQAETYEVLSNTETREKIINTVIAEAIQSGVDGINVDIENVSTEAGAHYIQFIRELSVKCRQNGLVLSVDNYPPKSYNMHFDYEEQGIVADYVVIMGYDEHYSSSLVAGSVSSISYVESGITEMLTMVSADKIISGIPFYTRLWASTPKTEEELAEQAGTEAGSYDYAVTSEALGMSAASTAVSEAGATAEWDETTMQNYATWTDGDTIYEIWLEDAASIEAKLQLMESYDLAGTAAWKLGFEDASIWSIIEKYVK